MEEDNAVCTDIAARDERRSLFDVTTFDNRDEYVPEHIRDAIRLYIDRGIPPGSFVEAVICNNLKDTFGKADIENRHHIRTIVAWFYWNAPAGCWGSVERYKDWIADRR